MATLNVDRSKQDPFYRYKMPPIVAKVEGKGNGIKTVVVNMVEVAKALDRPPTYPTKYFGCELGAQVQMDAKNERYIVNGAHDAARFQELLDGFIKRFVLCPECDNPETNLKVSAKKKKITQTCIACGHRSDMKLTHKLTTFIINNPPTGAAASGPKKMTKEERRAAKRAANGGHLAPPLSRGGSDDGSEASTILPGTASVRSNVEMRAEGTMEVPEIELKDEDEVEWSVDTSEEAVRARAGDLGGVAGLTMTDDLERPESERLGMFEDFVKERAEKSPLPIKEIVAEADRLDIGSKASLVIAGCLWNAESLLQSIKTSAPLLRRFAGKKPQRCILGALEKMVELHSSLLPKCPAVCKLFYDLDIVEEEVFLSWAEKGASKKYANKEVSGQVKAKVQPFIQWLAEAEEETDEESDDDVEIEYDSSAQSLKDTSAAAAEAAAESEDDVDIDAI